MTEFERTLLTLLNEKEDYGFGLAERILELEGKGPGHKLYPTLRHMESDGLLTSWDGAALEERGGRPRRYYKLTDAGKKALKDQMKAASAVRMKPVPTT